MVFQQQKREEFLSEER